MKIEIFVNAKWVEIEGCDFDDFMEQVVNEELPFRFVDCTEDEISDFAVYCANESAGLDDCDYYRLDFDFDTPQEVYIYDDYSCRVFEDYVTVINRRAKEINEILADIKKVE